VNKETIYTCYVIKRDRLLVGVVSAKTLLLSKPQERIGDIMDKNLIFAHTTEDQEAIIDLFKKYNLLSLPVVDKEQRLVGIVTVDDIVQAIEEETTEDFEKMAALTPSEEPYMKTGVLEQSHHRIYWLMFLMLSATITGSIISHFEDSLAVLPVLIAFIPMLMNTGGNAGCQSSTLVIRGIALDEIHFNDILEVLWREVRVGVVCGIVLGAVNFTRVYFMNEKDYMLSMTVSISLIVTVIMSKSVGCILPLVAKKMKFDPAIIAAPIITTIVDAASLIVYFSVAKMILSI
jgi:magnesium transporter